MKQRNGFLTAGLILTCALAALILLGFFWTPYDPNAMAAGATLEGELPAVKAKILQAIDQVKAE